MNLEVRQNVHADLEKRLGRHHAVRRLAIEKRRAGYITSGIQRVSSENWYSVYSLIGIALKITGLYARGVKNTAQIQIRHNRIRHASVPEAFRGFRILQISDLHADMSGLAVQRLVEILPELSYDVCVLTGDYRGQTYAPCEPALAGLARVRPVLREPIYGVLGNHDTTDMLLALEEMGARMLLNESVAIERAGARIHFAGVDDAHYYRAHNIEKALAAIPPDEFCVLLSHFQAMIGYTSTGVGVSGVPVRFNCPPEITLHHLEPA